MIPSPSFQHTIKPRRQGYAPCATLTRTSQHHARTSAQLPTSRVFVLRQAGSVRSSVPAGSMNYPIRSLSSALGTLGCVALGLQGCGVPTSTVDLTPGPDPVEFTVTPDVIQSGGWADVKVVSATADSIAIESENGLDRYWSAGPKLKVRVDSDFGDSIPQRQYAVREHGRLLDV